MALSDLYKSIGFEEEKGAKASAHLYPPDYVKTKISLALSSASTHIVFVCLFVCFFLCCVLCFCLTILVKIRFYLCYSTSDC
jgi:hypothetical protein